jgi:hypothetical protein
VGLELLLPRAVRSVVIRPPFLVLDHLALVVQVLLAQCIEQRCHPVRLEPQGELKLVGRHGLEVVGPIQPGRPVHGPAGRLDKRDVLGLRYVSGTLEHDVFEEVREAGLARNLVLRADRVPDVDRDDRREMVLGDDDAKAVGKALVAEHDLGNGRWHA